ncbi:MAG: hypothetical protein P1U87_07600 [Verrucomicrobiales bacterium]|nr:hypothetical protein [Verrucomicrobiales bacterium]
MHTWPFTTPCGFHQRYVVENKDRYLEGRYFFDKWDKALAARGLVKQQRELYRQRPDYQEAVGSFTWDLPADMQSDNFVGDMAKWWTETYPPTQPLFLQIGFPGPHPPYDGCLACLSDSLPEGRRSPFAIDPGFQCRVSDSLLRYLCDLSKAGSPDFDLRADAGFASSHAWSGSAVFSIPDN